MSDTPLTDARAQEPIEGAFTTDPAIINALAEWAAFSRDLERKLTQERANVELLKAAMDRSRMRNAT